jgi:FimV-like protein
MPDSDDQALLLQLARAYIDAGDYAGAREILEFDLRGNSEAIQLLQALPTCDYVLSKQRWPSPPSAEGLAELMRLVNLLEVDIERDPSHVFSATDRGSGVSLSCRLHRHWPITPILMFF